jgi:CDP-paratose 2-epimerase
VLNASQAQAAWQWAPIRTTEEILQEILEHARQHPEWLDISDPR